VPSQNRRERERASRHELILRTARELAETEGWDAVTTRRLSERIEYSQPVLYSHFAGKAEIVAGVALDGFRELTEWLRALPRTDPRARLAAVARGYLEFAAQHPAVYAAMFTLDVPLTFAAIDSPEPPRAAFGVLRDALGTATSEGDLETRTELFWSTLHGLATLTAGHRLRPEQAEELVALLIAQQG
jgi:AcrR family transcriptional regulator